MDHNFFPWPGLPRPGWCHLALMHSEYFQLTLAGPAKTTVTLLGQYQPLSGSDREWPFITSVLKPKIHSNSNSVVRATRRLLPLHFTGLAGIIYVEQISLSVWQRQSGQIYEGGDLSFIPPAARHYIVKTKSNIHFRCIVVVSGI